MQIKRTTYSYFKNNPQDVNARKMQYLDAMTKDIYSFTLLYSAKHHESYYTAVIFFYHSCKILQQWLLTLYHGFI